MLIRRFAQAACLLIATGMPPTTAQGEAPSAIDIGARRELFVDHYLIDKLDRATLQMHRPVDRGAVLAFDAPWEGPFCAYVTVLKAQDRYQMYYRGMSHVGTGDDDEQQVTCYAESADGITWTKPSLDLFPRNGHEKTNIVLADVAPVTHNFSPFIDARAGVKPDERYKAVGGDQKTGLIAYVSPDGIRWRKLRDQPVLTKALVQSPSLVFDSQNVPFWSEAEGKYLLYYRVYKDRKRRIARVESDDFLTWKDPTLMEYRRAPGAPDAPVEQLYTNQTHPYFRAPHLYVSTAARFMPGRRVLTTQQAEAIQVNPKYFNDTSDAVLMTSRGGNIYDRTFMEAFVAPGIGLENWTSRTNYPACGVVQTGRDEMSVYVNQNYGQPTSHLRRYSLRLDGFASVHADYDGGEMITRPLTFAAGKLLLNCSTSAAGGIRVEVQDADGKPVPGFALDDCHEVIGNEIERAVEWVGGGDVGKLAGKPLRLRFVAKDADLFALRFGRGR
jgi:hypothetical protein